MTRRHLRFSRRFSLRELWSTPQLLLEEKSSPEKDDDREGGKEVPTGGSQGADGKDDLMEASKDSIAFQADEDDKAQGTAGADGHVIEAKDRFSELGTFLISR